MEEFSFNLLDEGLGFHEKYPVSEPSARKEDSDIKKTGLLFSLKALDLPEFLDLEDRQSCRKLLSVLEKPYLGEKAFSPAGERFVKNPSKRSFPKLKNSSAPPVAEEKTPARDFFVSDQTTQPLVSEAVFDTPSKPALDKTSKPRALWLEKKLCFSLKAYLTDMLAVCFLFFPSFLLFVVLTQPGPLGLLKALGFKIFLVFILFSQVYCLICRLFCFETFGESLAGIRLFKSRALKEVHPFRLFLRFALSCVTGGALLPLLSVLFKKDIMAFLTGLYFYEKSKTHIK